MHSIVNNAWSANKEEKYDAFEGFCHGLFSNSRRTMGFHVCMCIYNYYEMHCSLSIENEKSGEKIVVNEIPNDWNAIAHNECH